MGHPHGKECECAACYARKYREKQAAPDLKLGYFQGDLVAYTGETKAIGKTLYYEQVFVEGHRKGELIHTQHAPK